MAQQSTNLKNTVKEPFQAIPYSISKLEQENEAAWLQEIPPGQCLEFSGDQPIKIQKSTSVNLALHPSNGRSP